MLKAVESSIRLAGVPETGIGRHASVCRGGVGLLSVHPSQKPPACLTSRTSPWIKHAQRMERAHAMQSGRRTRADGVVRQGATIVMAAASAEEVIPGSDLLIV